MSVTLLNTTNITVNAGTPGATLTPSTGASHLVAVVSYPDFDGQLTALSVGGVALTRLVGAHNSTNNEANGEIWYLVSPSNSAGQVVSVTLGTWKDVGISFHSISGASTPVIGNTTTDAHNAGTNLNGAVTCTVGDFVVAAASSDRTSGIGAWANSFSSDLSAASPNSLGSWATAHKTAASTTETANIQMAGGVNTWSAALSVAVFPAAGGGAAATQGPNVSAYGPGNAGPFNNTQFQAFRGFSNDLVTRPFFAAAGTVGTIPMPGPGIGPMRSRTFQKGLVQNVPAIRPNFTPAKQTAPNAIGFSFLHPSGRIN